MNKRLHGAEIIISNMKIGMFGRRLMSRRLSEVHRVAFTRVDTVSVTGLGTHTQTGHASP